jgi:hypothetical protein
MGAKTSRERTSILGGEECLAWADGDKRREDRKENRLREEMTSTKAWTRRRVQRKVRAMLRFKLAAAQFHLEVVIGA